MLPDNISGTSDSGGTGIIRKILYYFSEEIEGRVTKKLSQEFNGTKNHVLGALARPDDFLMKPLIQGHSGTAPEMSRNAVSSNQGRNEDDSQSDPHPEAGIFLSQTTHNSGPEDGRDISAAESWFRADSLWKSAVQRWILQFWTSRIQRKSELISADVFQVFWNSVEKRQISETALLGAVGLSLGLQQGLVGDRKFGSMKLRSWDSRKFQYFRKTVDLENECRDECFTKFHDEYQDDFSNLFAFLRLFSTPFLSSSINFEIRLNWDTQSILISLGNKYHNYCYSKIQITSKYCVAKRFSRSLFHCLQEYLL